ncbi:alcohol dehydrogenase transcription factor myb/SANT-like domain-containing protein [Phthorimaea operculella]|nr:alcohol dehydrogenase transcription factor myb/SANT-like domain-containing protein [Phthorimaea operculella]
MEHLIESVRKYPCLWNTTAIEYRDQELKDAAWAEVMKETDLSSGKHKHEVNGNHRARSSSSSDSDASPARSDPAAGSPPPPPPAKRRALDHIDRKLAYLVKRRRSPPPPPHSAAALAAQPDPLDIFFNSMCQATKRLPFLTQIKIKRALFEVVTAGEEALLEQQASYAGMWQATAGGAAARGGDGSSSSSEGGAPDEDDHKPAV